MTPEHTGKSNTFAEITGPHQDEIGKFIEAVLTQELGGRGTKKSFARLLIQRTITSRLANGSNKAKVNPQELDETTMLKQQQVWGINPEDLRRMTALAEDIAATVTQFMGEPKNGQKTFRKFIGKRYPPRSTQPSSTRENTVLSPDIENILFGEVTHTWISKRGLTEPEITAWGQAIARGEVPQIETETGETIATIPEFENYIRSRMKKK